MGITPEAIEEEAKRLQLDFFKFYFEHPTPLNKNKTWEDIEEWQRKRFRNVAKEILERHAQKPNQVIVNCQDEALAREFTGWMCGQGEQDMWIWMECRTADKDIPAEVGQPLYDYENNIITIPYIFESNSN